MASKLGQVGLGEMSLTLNRFIEHLAEFIWQNRQQIRQLDMLQTQLPLDMRGGTLHMVSKD